jgi:hypothetical protein
MCDPTGTKKAGKKADREAERVYEETKAKEALRQKNIKLGRKNIDAAFKGYDAKYYGKYRDSSLALQNGNINDQYADARDKLTASLADRGMGQSTPGINAFAEARGQFDDARLRSANEADGAVSDLKTKIAGRKSDLYALNQSAADPQGVMAQATGAASALAAPAQYNPLADIFTGVINTYAASRAAQQNAPVPSYTYRPASSGKVIY